MKIKILSYNIHKGFNTFNTQFLLAEMKSAIKETGCDLVFLQEVVGENLIFKNKIKNWPTQAQFEFLADTLWPHYAYGKNAVFTKRHHGNAILSSFPITNTHNLNISTHRFEQRGLLHAEILAPPQGGTKVHLLNTHIDLLGWSRKIQINKICHYIEKNIPHNELIIFSGDFNDWRQEIGHEFKQLHNLDEAHLHANGKLAKTFPQFFPVLSLDRIYFRGLNLLKCETLSNGIWKQLSDHLPLYAEMEFS
jgi:endonuclease/exonuclease/phosphatase family metal-dependent hydrolase